MMHVAFDNSLDIEIMICSLLAGVERGLQLRLIKILNIPNETPSVGSRATHLIQLIVQKQVGLIFSKPPL